MYISICININKSDNLNRILTDYLFSLMELLFQLLNVLLIVLYGALELQVPLIYDGFYLLLVLIFQIFGYFTHFCLFMLI